MYMNTHAMIDLGGGEGGECRVDIHVDILSAEVTAHDCQGQESQNPICL